jgi:microcin C transport system substrate-binding protein
MTRFRLPLLSLATTLALALSTASVRAENPAPTHGISMYGDLKYGPDFEHFEYANPNAPNGGVITLSASGTFDNLNPFIVKGDTAAGVSALFETLATASLDEPFSRYGLIAESMIMPEDRSWIAFNINPRARWHDGKPITPEDVIFSLDILRTEGHPLYRTYYADVAKAEKTGDRQVTFAFDEGTNRELPLIISDLPVLPKHYYEKREFNRTTLEPPLGSGPYRIKRLEPGRSIVFEKVPDYWGADLPVNRGRNNFDEMRYEYYRDRDVAFEAFKAGEFDLWAENSAKRWATGYDGPRFAQGLIIKEEVPITPAARMQGYVFNLRREKFQDPRVRQAIGLAFDFEWANAHLMYNDYERIVSYFHGEDDLMATDLPSEAELALLEPYRDQLPAEVFTQVYQPPTTDGSGNNRRNLRKALQLLEEAGWVVENGRLVNEQTGQPFEFEILMADPSGERLAAPFVKNLERLGIRAHIRAVDSAQYQNRMDAFDFDVTTELWPQSDSPGNEQREMWGSAAADLAGSRNTAGIKSPVIDALVEKVISAPTREDLETAVRALDRVLLWGHYVVPHFTDDGIKLAYWNKFARPEVLPEEGLDLMTWWIDPVKVAAIENRQTQSGGAKAGTIE